MAITVEIVPCLEDNYAYLVTAPGGEVAVVDPSQAQPVLQALAGRKLSQIWCTHHHHDHVGGVRELAAGIPVLGSAYDLSRIDGQTRGLTDGETVMLGAARFVARGVAGHTLGAIAYCGEGAAFTGDTLFGAGCGRLFEGDAAMMHASLSLLAALDPQTLLYVGHEYTEKNLRFAAVVEPESAAVRARLQRVIAGRGQPTVPCVLAAELETNPFLRCDAPAVRAFAAARGEASSAADVFARVREAKDTFS